MRKKNTPGGQRNFLIETLEVRKLLSSTSANLLTNGGFEDEPDFADSVSGYGVNGGDEGFSLLVGNQIPGWTIVSGHGVTVHNTKEYPVISGNYGVNTDGEGYNGNNADFYQDFETSKGTTYKLEFDWAGWENYAPTTQLSVKLTGVGSSTDLFDGLYSYDDSTNHVSSNFQGTGGSVRLEISESPQSGFNDDQFNVDNFSVTPSGGKLVFLKSPSKGNSGDPIKPAIRVAEETTKGKIVTSDNSTQVTLNIDGTNSGNPITGNTATVVGGIATFSDLTLTKPDTYVLQGTDDNGDASVTSKAFKVAGLHLVFTEKPESTDVDSPLQFKVAIENASNRVDTTASGEVQVSLSGTATPAASLEAKPLAEVGDGSLIGTTVLSFVNGVANFSKALNDKINEAGTYVLGAVEYVLNGGVFSPSDTTASATSNPIDITGLHMVFKRLPEEIDAGVAVNPAIEIAVKNVKNRTVTSNTDLIELDWFGPSDPADANPLTATAVKGVATFDDVRFPTVGVITFTTFDSTTSEAALASTDGTPDPVASASASAKVVPLHLAFKKLPETVDLNTAIEPSLQVVVENSRNQTVKDNTNQITLTDSLPDGTIVGTYAANASNGKANFAGVKFGQVDLHTLASTDNTSVMVVSLYKHGAADYVTDGSDKIEVLGYHLKISEIPASFDATVASSKPIKVEILDSKNHLVKTNTDTILLEATNGNVTQDYGGPTSQGTTDITALQFEFAGSVPIVVFDQTSQTAAKAAGTTDPVERATDTLLVSPLHLVFKSVPRSATANTVITPPVEVEIENRDNQRVKDDSDAIDVMQASTGTSGTDFVVNATDGIATFNSLMLTQTGIITLEAVDGNTSNEALHAGLTDPVTHATIDIVGK